MISMYIATVYPCILSIGNGGFVSFVNSQGPGDKPLGQTTNFKSLELPRNLTTCFVTINFYRHLSSK